MTCTVVCNVEGCEKVSQHPRKGMCNMHYLRQHRHGSTEAPGRKNHDKRREALSDVRTCYGCEQTLGSEFFSAYMWSVTKERAKCRECCSLYAFARKVGVPEEEVRRFVATEPRECQICGTEEDLVKDHCHTTRRLRGWLCRNHNFLLGHAGDDPAVLQAAIKYLEAHLLD